MISALMIVLNMAFAATPADGSYLRSCYVVGDDDVLQSALQIQQNKWIQTHTAFEEDSCQTPYLIFETQYRALVVDSNVDLVVEEVSYTTLSKEVSDALNLIKYCGFTNWKAHQKKIVTGLLCDEFQAPKAAEILFSIFKIQVNADQSIALYLGKPAAGEDGKSSSTRYRGIEAAPYLKLQP